MAASESRVVRDPRSGGCRDPQNGSHPLHQHLRQLGRLLPPPTTEPPTGQARRNPKHLDGLLFSNGGGVLGIDLPQASMASICAYCWRYGANHPAAGFPPGPHCFVTSPSGAGDQAAACRFGSTTRSSWHRTDPCQLSVDTDLGKGYRAQGSASRSAGTPTLPECGLTGTARTRGTTAASTSITGAMLR